MLSMNVDQIPSETDFLDCICLPDWRQMENASDLRSTFIDCSEPSRLSPIRCNKVAYLIATNQRVVAAKRQQRGLVAVTIRVSVLFYSSAI